MRTWRLVFDLDDTLYLERDYVRSGFQAVAHWAACTHGIDRLFDACWTAFEQGVRDHIFDLALQTLRGSADRRLVAELVGVYRAHTPRITLAPDAVAMLRRLEGNTRLALITDGPPVSQRKKIESLQMARWFESIVVTDEIAVAFRKPHPRAFEIVQGRMEAPGARFAYIADNPHKDFTAPRSMGWTTVRIRRSGGLHSTIEVPGEGGDLEITSLDEIPAALEVADFRPAAKGR